MFLLQKKMDINPWQVDNIQEFYFLKCPECDFMHKEESDFQNHAVENHPLSVTFFGEEDMTIEKVGIFDDHNEENESSNALNTVTEEILEIRNNHEIHEQIFEIENEVKQEVQDSEECQMSEISPLSLPRPLAELGAIESSSKLVCEEFAC